MQEIKHDSTLLSAKGGTLDYVRDKEILASVMVPPGLHRARPYVVAAPDGAVVQVGGGLVVIDPPSGYGVVPYGDGSHDVGANPDWQPMSNADQLAHQMRLSIDRLNRNNDRLERRIRAMASVERIPVAQAVPPQQEADTPVVE